MDISSPMRSLIPSLDSAVFEVLSGTESALGATQIVRLAGRGSRQGIQVVLDRLTEHGLVLAQPTNRGSMYRLNRSHLLAPAVLSASKVRLEFMDRLAAAVRSLDPSPVQVSLFGSFARGGGDQDSDIDLFLLMPDDFIADESWESGMRRLEDDVHAWTGNRLEVLLLDQQGLRKAVRNQELIVSELRDGAVVLLGSDLPTLISRDEESVGRPA